MISACLETKATNTGRVWVELARVQSRAEWEFSIIFYHIGLPVLGAKKPWTNLADHNEQSSC